MTDLSALTLGVPQAATATLAVMLVVPLAFLARPCRATLLWALMTIVAAAGIYTVLSAELVGAERVRRVALAGMLAAVPLLWSGLRAWRGARAHEWAAPAYGVAAIVALGVVPDDAFSVAFRIVFYGASVFAGLSAVELRRLPERDTGPLIPLVVLCTLFAALGLAVLVGGVLAPGAAGDFSMVRAVNSIGVIAFLVCALLAVITLAQSGPASAAATRGDALRTVADRLRRARARGETGWALLAVQLDDAAELSQVLGRDRFHDLAARFQDTVEGAVPADADVVVDDEGRVLVLVNRTEAVLQQHVEAVLAAVGGSTDPSRFVRLSASVGWTSVRPDDVDAAGVVARAIAAAAEAAHAGGDRTVRADAR
ncbi:hypothetical protein [Microbacterium sp. GXF7504]